MRVLIVGGLAALCAGCATTETVQFRPSASQQAMTRDGQSALISRGKSSIVMVRPAGREVAANGRPVFIVNLENTGTAPADFRMAEVKARTTAGHEIPILTYESLVKEERNRQVAMAILTGLSAGANSWSAAQYGGYWANRAASYDNAAMFHNAAVTGQANLEQLEDTALKDHTLMPGERYAGQLHISPPPGDGTKTYQVSLMVGADRHEIHVDQVAK